MSGPARTGEDRMPPAVYVLALAVFAMGTSEFMLAGLLPDMAADLGVSVPDAGLLISAFAAGMVVGAPLLTLATLRLPRRATLMGSLAVFVLAHVAGALAPGYGVLFGVRAAVPAGRARAGAAAPRVRDELRTMARPRLWLAYGTVALSFSSMMATFSYLGALLTGTTGLPERWVPACWPCTAWAR